MVSSMYSYTSMMRKVLAVKITTFVIVRADCKYMFFRSEDKTTFFNWYFFTSTFECII